MSELDITPKNFNSKLASWVKGASSMRQGCQDIIQFGMGMYVSHGDSGYLTRLYQSAVGIKGLNATRLSGYIKAHSNLHMSKADDGQWVFKKAAKGPAEIKPLLTPWWDFERAARVAATKISAFARITAVANTLEKAMEDPTVSIELADVDAALSKLQAVVAKAKRAHLTLVEQAA